MKGIIILMLVSMGVTAQERRRDPFKGANRVVVMNSNDAKANFKAAVTLLLESGYSIDKKDDEYFTIKTQNKTTKRNSIYFFNLWAKDSSIIISGLADPNIELPGLVSVKSTFQEIKQGGMKNSDLRITFDEMSKIASGLPGSVYFEKK